MSSSLLPITSEPRKRLIIKISYPQKRVNDDSFNDDHSQKRRRINEHYGKPIVSCYWLDSTISLSEHNKNKNILSHTNDQKSFGEENSKGLEKNKSKVQKTIGLKDIEAKLKSYSTPDEFAKDMRFVFSQGLLYHPRHIVHRIAVKFSETWQLV
ncbi:uncharacterized protein LOC123892354 [Trifolium pratense]|uniref:uncharacterized protein LOC123892354 n=1 Tax=Trifolium pratense TaxID=57577 RepID=UPI001E697D51|nr:uncharacterized protein LOC123892354 [Trifolium pratense]